MTRHVGRDTVLKLALGLLEPGGEQRARDHLRECPKCLALKEEAERTLEVIADVTPGVDARLPSLSSVRPVRTGWLRVAAMLAVGFALGVLASDSLRSPAVTVVHQQIVPAPPVSAADGFVACDAIDIPGQVRWREL
jgi:hypothetical protein